MSMLMCGCRHTEPTPPPPTLFYLGEEGALGDEVRTAYLAFVPGGRALQSETEIECMVSWNPAFDLVELQAGVPHCLVTSPARVFLDQGEPAAAPVELRLFCATAIDRPVTLARLVFRDRSRLPSTLGPWQRLNLQWCQPPPTAHAVTHAEPYGLVLREPGPRAERIPIVIGVEQGQAP